MRTVMKKAPAITGLFLDIGGVLLTNGWDHHARKRAARNFKLKWAGCRAMQAGTLPIFVLAISLASASTAAELAGKVVHIADGDTLTILDAQNTQHKIRLFGIDAPEKNQPFGSKSREALASQVHEKQVRIDTHGKDRYGRTVGTVFVEGHDANLWMVENGWAWWYRHYAKHEVALEQAEQQARNAKLGLWRDAHPVAPWEWRRTEREWRR